MPASSPTLACLVLAAANPLWTALLWATPNRRHPARHIRAFCRRRLALRHSSARTGDDKPRGGQTRSSRIRGTRTANELIVTDWLHGRAATRNNATDAVLRGLRESARK